VYRQSSALGGDWAPGSAVFEYNGLPFWQIGSEGGFLPAPAELSQLLLAPAERADVIVDFTRAPVGSEIVLQNLGPDEPFGGGEPDEDFDTANPATAGQVMRLQVVASRHRDTSRRPDQLDLPELEPLGAASNTRRVSLNEEDSAVLPGVGPRAALLGTMNGTPTPLGWDDPVTENPAVGATEVWELYNFTADAHPIHVHEVQFQVVDRQPIAGGPSRPAEGGNRLQGHGDRLPGRDHAHQGALRRRRQVRLALPHRRARGPRDDAALPDRPACLTTASGRAAGGSSA
jgi:FtsP/CotA-like multicopper oxidase with cupredoxin domain